MKQKRFSVELIAAVLKRAEVRVPVAEVIRKAGNSGQTFYRWKKEYAGRGVEAIAGGECAAETAGGRVDLGQKNAVGRVVKKVLKPSQRRSIIEHWRERYGVSGWTARRFGRMSRRTYGYHCHKDPRTALRMCGFGNWPKRECDTDIVRSWRC